MEIVFDTKQKHSGFNKYGHYQFGCLTCPFCKSDRTERTKQPECKEEGKYKYLNQCHDCTGVFGSDY